ncbi:MAG: NUDIX hydrolase [Anaerolineae bacterium]|jgi:ADP-ribose pyrophosphatase
MPLWETLNSRLIWESRWYNLRQDRLRTQEGHKFTYTLVDHPGAVWVVPVTSDGLVVLIRQYRYTVDDWCYEVPAGGLSTGLDQSQRTSGSRLVQSEEVAHHELLEEVGGTATDLRYVGQFYTSNGISNEVAYIYLATGVELGAAQPEPTELMEVRLVPVNEALRMARNGQISDGPSALALLWCESLLT